MRLVWVLALLSFLVIVSPCDSQEIDSLDMEIFLSSLVETAGQVISGGVFYSANTHGGVPHFAFGAGTNVVSFEADNPLDTTDVLKTMIPTFMMYGSLGILPGFSTSPMVGGMGSIDLIGRFGFFPMIGDYADYARYVPTIYGGGVRIGVFRNSLLAPAISLTATYTKISGMKYMFSDSTADAEATVNLGVLSIHADVSKNLALITPYAGMGWDQHYFKGSYWIRFNDPGETKVEGAMNLRPTSIRIYGGLELGLVIIRLNAEGGMTGGNAYFAVGGRVGI